MNSRTDGLAKQDDLAQNHARSPRPTIFNVKSVGSKDPRVQEFLAMLDVDGDGKVTQDEVEQAAERYLLSKETVTRRNWQILLVALVGVVAVIAAVFGTNIAASELSKETHITRNASMVDDRGKAVVVSTQHTVTSGKMLQPGQRRLMKGSGHRQLDGPALASVECSEAMAVFDSGTTQGEVRHKLTDGEETRQYVYAGLVSEATRTSTTLTVTNMVLTRTPFVVGDEPKKSTYNVECTLAGSKCPSSDSTCLVSSHSKLDEGHTRERHRRVLTTTTGEHHVLHLPEHLHFDRQLAEKENHDCFSYFCFHGDKNCHFPVSRTVEHLENDGISPKCHIWGRRRLWYGLSFTSKCYEFRRFGFKVGPSTVSFCTKSQHKNTNRDCNKYCKDFNKDQRYGGPKCLWDGTERCYAICSTLGKNDCIKELGCEWDGTTCIESDLQKNICHPADAVVHVMSDSSSKLVRMDELKIGDLVWDSNDFQPITGFSHASKEHGVFWKFTTEPSGKSLEISSNHYLYANGKKIVSDDVQIGDVLSYGDEDLSDEYVIEKVRVIKKGRYHPHTRSGKLVVNGFLTSTDTTLYPLIAWDFLNKFGAFLFDNGIYVNMGDVQEDSFWFNCLQHSKTMSPISEYFVDSVPTPLIPIVSTLFIIENLAYGAFCCQGFAIVSFALFGTFFIGRRDIKS